MLFHMEQLFNDTPDKGQKKEAHKGASFFI